MKNNILNLAIVLTVGVILAGSLLMPVISDATTTERTFTNDGYYHMNLISSADSDVVLTWDHTDPYKITVGDVVVDLPKSYVIPCTLVCSDDWGLRYLLSNGNVTVDLSVFAGPGDGTYDASTSTGNDMTITLSNGTATFDNGSTPVTHAYSEAYAISNGDGEYVMKKTTDTAYLKSDSSIYGVGRTYLNFSTPKSLNINVSGTIEDGATVTIFNPLSGYSVSNIVVANSAVAGYNDLYTFTSVSFDVTDSTPTTLGAVYSQVIVPYEVTAELTNHLTPGEIALINIIPVMVIVALLMVAVGGLYLRRND